MSLNTQFETAVRDQPASCTLDAKPFRAIEMAIEPGAEALLERMGKVMKTKARSKIIERILNHIRHDFHVSEVSAWFSEPRIASARRTTLRLSSQNIDYLASLAELVGKGRPSVIMDIVYFAGVKLTRDDLELL